MLSIRTITESVAGDILLNMNLSQQKVKKKTKKTKISLLSNTTFFKYGKTD